MIIIQEEKQGIRINNLDIELMMLDKYIYKITAQEFQKENTSEVA